MSGEWVKTYLLLYHPEGLSSTDPVFKPYEEPYGTAMVDFERVEVLRGVSTRGNAMSGEWVKTYLLLYHPEGLSSTDPVFKPYEEPYGTAMVFSGNVDSNSTVTNYLKAHIPTRHIRLQPQTWQGYIALQMDILVCETGCQEVALITGPTPLPDDHLTASSAMALHGPQTSRLMSQGQTATGWHARLTQSDQFIQDGRTWSNYTQNGTTQVLSGNYDPDTVHKHYLTPITARYVRLHPLTWNGGIVVRWELYGKNAMKVLGCYTDHTTDRDLPYEPLTDPADGMDPVLCTRHCFSKGYYFAGLQAQDRCYCGNSYGRYGISPDCNLKCRNQPQFICGGLAANFVYTTGLTSGHKVCPAGWTRFEDECYGLMNGTLDWQSAHADCLSRRGDLASVADDITNQLLYSLMGTATVAGPAWIGLSDLREERYFEWSNTEDVVFTNWDLNQPATTLSRDNGHCVAINNQGMYAYTYSCYVLVEDSNTKLEAAEKCQAFFGHLVTINDRYEQAFLSSLLAGRTGLYWTDASDSNDPGRFTYVDGQQPVTFTNWAANMPDSHNKGHCVAMSAGSIGAGLWRNQNCRSSLKALNNQAATLQRTWAGARADCHEQTADLASFQDATVMDTFWRQKLLGSSNHYWIGLHSTNTGELLWSDGSPVGLTGPWAPGQPDTANGTRTCVELQVTSGVLALQDCGLRRNWLCAIRRAGSCAPLSDAWKRYGDNCYYVADVSGNGAATWRQARSACRDQGADLASVTSIQENMFILKMAQRTSQQSIWIGLSELQSDAGFYGWSDGSSVSFINWDSRPDDAGGEEACAEMLVRSGKWNDNHCALSQGYVCKRNMVTMTLPPTSSVSTEGGCPDGMVAFFSRCYGVYGQPSSGKSWQDAMNDCKQRSTPFLKVTLASIRNARENAFLTTQLLNSGLLAWIGLHLVDQKYLWIDNEELLYTNWDTGEPNGAEQEGCVHLYSRGANAGRWNDAACSRKMGWVCQSNRFAYMDQPTTTRSTCPAGFQSLGSACYRYLNTTVSWHDAEDQCVSMGAHLTKNVFGWSDGWPVMFTHWGPGEPSEDADEGCVSMMPDGIWNEDICSNPRKFVCKTTSESPPYSPAPGSGTCPGDDWQPFGDHCFAFHSTERVPFAHAMFLCEQEGATLVSIHDNATNVFLQQQVKATSPLPVWIGLRRSELDGFFWGDNSGVDFTNWESNYPREVTKDGVELLCAHLSPWNGRWTDEECAAANAYETSGGSLSSPTSAESASRAYSQANKPVPSTLSRATTNFLPSTPTPRTATSHTAIVVTPPPPMFTSTPTPVRSTTTRSAPSGSITHTSRMTSDKANESGLGGGAVAGIVVGVVVLSVTVIVLIIFLRRRHNERSTAGFTNALYKGEQGQVHLS
ncbi:hypothetical protein BaRGS_00012145 [Batillaria attramentaria]|uniref:Macrophage mannose receptor 1-like n=1 Tax=Batillaria attramentaria TaxID=370345 RepID=A0ABD0LAU5_9CAEN